MFKVSIGIAVAVVTCAIGVSASVASAATFHSESANTFFEFADEGVQVLTTDVGEIECANFTAIGEVIGNKAPELLTAGGAGSGWEECEFLGQPVNEFESECEFVLRSEHMLTIQSPPGGNCTSVPLTFDALGVCRVKFGPQTRTEVDYENKGVGEKQTIDADLNVSNLSYTWNGPLCGVGSDTNGTYVGNISITGTDQNTGKQTGIWWK